MRPLLLVPLLVLSACATPGQAPSRASRAQLPPFRAAPPMTQLAQKRAAIRHAAAQAILARTEAGPEEVEQAALHLEAACRDGHTGSCEFLTVHATPVRGQCERLQVTQAFFTAKANAEIHVRCRISATGASESCAVVLDEPYGMTERHLKSRQECSYEPARLMGRPYPTYDLSTVELMSPVMEIAGGRTRPMGDPLHEARRRADTFPQSSSAQRHLALLLEQRHSGSEEHLRVLQRARQQLPHDAALLAASARQSMVQGRRSEAFKLALEAVQAQPFSFPILQTYAAAASLVGHCTDAVRAQRHTLAMFGPDSSDREREQMTERLRAYEQQCAAVAQPTMP